MFSLSSTQGFLNSQSQLKKPHGWESDYYNSGIGPRLALTESQTLKITQQIAVSRLCHQMCFFSLVLHSPWHRGDSHHLWCWRARVGFIYFNPRYFARRLKAFGCCVPTSMQQCWSSLTFCQSFWLVVPAAVLNLSVWGIEFTLNNTSQLIVPNKIICLLAKAPPGICISGTTGRKNKEAN